MVWRNLPWKLLLCVLMPTLVFAVGNEPVSTPLPDPQVSTFKVDGQNYWKNELPRVLGRYFPSGWVYTGGSHATAATCTSAAFAVDAFVSGPPGDRVGAKSDGTGGTAAINYALVGANCANPGSDTARVAVCSLSGDATGNWQRAVGSNYFVNAVDTAPAIPTGCAGLVDATILNGAITTVASIARHGPIRLVDTVGLINVQDFGADPDDSGDDTASILAAIATIPSVPAAQGGSGCLYFPLPKTVGGFYKVSSTLDFTNKFNACMLAPGKLSRDQQDPVTERTALLKWYGGTNKNVILLHNTHGMTLKNISVNCRDIADTRGIALGADATQVSSVKFNSGEGLEFSHCDVGMRFGDFAANGPDVASNTFTDVLVQYNKSQGVAQNSGNGVLQMYGLGAFCNGFAPTGGKTGANVYAEGGTVALYSYIGFGEGAGCKPVAGDIYGASVGLKIYDAWSEVHGPFVTNAGSPLQASTISASHHYNATMTDTLVPKSIVWASSNTLVIDGFYFTNVEVNAGANALVVDQGTQFYAGAQHDLGVVPTFTGTAISGQQAYMGFPAGAQRGRLALGRPPRTDLGATPPVAELTGLAQKPLVALCTTDVGNSCGVWSYQPAVGSLIFLGNGYFDGTNFKSIASGRMSSFRMQGGDPAAGQPALQVEIDNATAAGQTKFAGGADHINLLKVAHVSTGTTFVPVAKIGLQSIGWASAAPTVGAWVIGDVIFNIVPASGVPSGWMCSASGTPGTWKPLANIP